MFWQNPAPLGLGREKKTVWQEGRDAGKRLLLSRKSRHFQRPSKLRREQDFSNTNKVMWSKAERVFGRNQETSLSDEAPRANQAYHCQLALCSLIWELFIILDRILRGDFCMSRRYILAGNSKWQNQHTKTQSYQHWSLWIIVKQVRSHMTLQVFKSKWGYNTTGWHMSHLEICFKFPTKNGLLMQISRKLI